MRYTVVLLLLVAAHAQDTEAIVRGMPAFKAANTHAGKGEYAAAIADLNVALPHFRKAGDPQLLAVIFTMRGFCRDRLGLYAEALPDHQTALEILGRLPNTDREEVALALNQLAVCLMHLGRGQAALGRVEAGLAMQRRLARGKDKQGVAKALNDTALCLLELGRPAEALKKSQESVAIGRRLHPGGSPALAVSLDNLARCLGEVGRHPEALAVREEVMALTRRLFKGDNEQVAQSHANLAYTLHRLGRTDEALPRFEEAKAIMTRVHKGDHREVATALNNEAACLHDMGRHEKALGLELEALAMLRRIFRGDHPDVAMLLHNVASAKRGLGRLEDALADYDAALAMRRRLYVGDQPEVARTMHDRANCLKQMGRVDESVAIQKEALAMVRRLESPLVHAHAANLGNTLLRDLDRPADAVPLLEEAIAHIEERRRQALGFTEQDRAAYVESLTRFRAFDSMVRAQLRLGRPDEALTYLERGRARSLLDLLERSRFDPLKEVRREAGDDKERLAELDALDAALEQAEHETGLAAQALSAARERTDLERPERKALIRRVRSKQAQAEARRRELLRARARLIKSRLAMARPANAKTIQAMLAPDERLCLYSIDDLDGVLLVVSAKAIRGYPLALDAARAAKLVRTFRYTILDRRKVDDQARELFDAIMPAAAWKDVRTARRVHIVPHAALHRLPFEALMVAPGKFWFDAGPEIAYAASGSALLWSRRSRDRQRTGKRLSEALALGDPIFTRGLVPLPGTRREVAAIRTILAPLEVRTLLGKDATEANLYAAAPRARYLHLATHQISAASRRVSYTSLALTTPAKPTPNDDGHLRLIDLFEHWRGRLARCELVVLSACKTQIGKELKDEGVLAMPWGFQFAGAPCVIASLWQVDDDSTAELFTDFYRQLKDGGDKLAAFTNARRALRKKKPQPYFWAPFICIGDPR